MRDGGAQGRDTLPLVFVAPRPTGPSGAPPSFSLGLLGGPAQPWPRTPASSPRGRRGMRRGPGGPGRGGEGKEVGLWRRDPMSPKNVRGSQPF